MPHKFSQVEPYKIATQTNIFAPWTPPFEIDTPVIEHLYNEQPMSKINKVCVFECHKVNIATDEEEEEAALLPIIHAVDYQEFTITNPTQQLYIEFANGSSHQLPFQANAVGAYHLRLPCNATLNQQTRTSKDLSLIHISEPTRPY